MLLRLFSWEGACMVSFAFWEDHSFAIVKEKWAADNIRSMGQWGSCSHPSKDDKALL